MVLNPYRGLKTRLPPAVGPKADVAADTFVAFTPDDANSMCSQRSFRYGLRGDASPLESGFGRMAYHAKKRFPALSRKDAAFSESRRPA